MKPSRSIDVPDAPSFRRFEVTRPGSGAVAVIVIAGDPSEVELLLSAARSEMKKAVESIDGPRPCIGCGDR